MKHWPPLPGLLLILLFTAVQSIAQYLPNPSFEGIPMPHVPPSGWAICTPGNSTPDVQPGNFGVFMPPSHGNTYLGMTARDDFTWEDVHSNLITPLSKDSCYIFRIDLCFQEIVNGLTMLPITLKIYGHNTSCNKTNLLWQSPATGNEEWVTHEFPISPTDYDITDIVLEAYYSGTTVYWGYILIDNIIIENDPQPDLGNDTTLTLCPDEYFEINAGGGYAAYLWNDGSTDSVLQVNTSGTYWVQVMNQYGCTAADSIDIEIEPYEEMETSLIDSTFICQGWEVTVLVQVEQGSAPYSYNWLNTGDTTASVTFVVDSTDFYVVEITDQCGNTVMDSVKIVVMDGPDVDLGEDQLICPGEEFELSPGSGYNGYVWQDGSTDSVYVVTQPGWYWVTVTDAIGCVNTDSVYIDFYPDMNFDLGEDTLLCEIDFIILDAGSDWMAYLWFDGSTNQTIEVYQEGYYWVTVTDENGCTDTDTIYVGLSPAVLVNLGPDTTVCSGDNYVIDPGYNFETYLWQDGSTDPFFPVENPGLYWVSVTDDYGCSGTDSIYIDVNPSPEVSLGNDTVICTGNSIFLDPGSQYSSYLWQDNSTLPVYTVTSTGLYTVTVTNIFNCAATDEVFVDVTSPDIELGADTIVCLGDTLFLDPGQGYSSYLWQDNSTQAVYPVVDGGTYTVEVTDQYNCKSTDEIIVDPVPIPVADLGDDKQLCEGGTVLLETTDGPFEYLWNSEQGIASFEVLSGGTYTVTVINQCGVAEDQVLVSEFPVPQVNLGEDQVILEGETIELDAGAGYDQYLWQDGSGDRFFIITSGNVDPENPYYFVEVTDGPCKNSDTTKIVLFRVKVPNVFTPNGDGFNDTFTPMKSGWNGVTKHHIDVFNRWGEKVWESDDFPSGWDGKRNGKPLASGTYYWVLEVFYGSDQVKETLKGTVSILDSE